MNTVHLSNFVMTPTVAEWLTQWLKKYKKEVLQASTYQNYAAILKPVQEKFRKKSLADWKSEEIQEYFDELVELGQYSTAQHLLALLIPALNQAVKEAIIFSNPAKKIKLPQENGVKSNVLTVENQELFLRALSDERLSNFFRFQLLTGLRPGEMCALRWEDLDLEAGKVIVSRNVRREKKDDGPSELSSSATKSGKSRVLELTDGMLELLEQQMNLQELEIEKGKYANTCLIFPNRKGKYLEVSSLNRTLARIQLKMREIKAEELGLSVNEVEISHFSAHGLRHTFATRALEADIPLKVVSEWLGHSTVRVTGDIYSHVSPEMRCASLKRLEQYLTKTFAFSSEKSPETESF